MQDAARHIAELETIEDPGGIFVGEVVRVRQHAYVFGIERVQLVHALNELQFVAHPLTVSQAGAGSQAAQAPVPTAVVLLWACSSIDRDPALVMTKPVVSEVAERANTVPATRPSEVSSGPPELPGMTRA